jgi:hypothetical protein
LPDPEPELSEEEEEDESEELDEDESLELALRVPCGVVVARGADAGVASSDADVVLPGDTRV